MPQMFAPVQDGAVRSRARRISTLRSLRNAHERLWSQARFGARQKRDRRGCPHARKPSVVLMSLRSKLEALRRRERSVVGLSA